MARKKRVVCQHAFAMCHPWSLQEAQGLQIRTSTWDFSRQLSPGPSEVPRGSRDWRSPALSPPSFALLFFGLSFRHSWSPSVSRFVVTEHSGWWPASVLSFPEALLSGICLLSGWRKFFPQLIEGFLDRKEGRIQGFNELYCHTSSHLHYSGTKLGRSGSLNKKKC